MYVAAGWRSWRLGYGFRVWWKLYIAITATAPLSSPLQCSSYYLHGSTSCLQLTHACFHTVFALFAAGHSNAQLTDHICWADQPQTFLLGEPHDPASAQVCNHWCWRVTVMSAAYPLWLRGAAAAHGLSFGTRSSLPTPAPSAGLQMALTGRAAAVFHIPEG